MPVAYYSKQLLGAQRHYSATELEGLALFKAIHHFSHFLWGQRFTVWTDHKALVALLKSRRLNRRLHGWVLKLMDFDFEVIYRPGNSNNDADGLSRQAWNSKTEQPWEEERERERERLEVQPRTTDISSWGRCGDQPHQGLLGMGRREPWTGVCIMCCD